MVGPPELRVCRFVERGLRMARPRLTAGGSRVDLSAGVHIGSPDELVRMCGIGAPSRRGSPHRG
jgi:hypothetical protein